MTSPSEHPTANSTSVHGGELADCRYSEPQRSQSISAAMEKPALDNVQRT